jgi:putative membrane protein
MKGFWKHGLLLSSLVALAGCGNALDDFRGNLLGSTNVRTFTDAEVASMAATLNDAEISAGQIADSRLTDPMVKAFARQMIDQHSVANGRMAQLSADDIIPFDNPVSQALLAMSEQLGSALANQPPFTVDQIYLTSQIQMHAQALTLLDCAMVPNSQDDVLDTLIAQMRSDVQDHLLEAQQLRTDLNYADNGEGNVVRCVDICAQSGEGQANAAAYPVALRTAICR